VLSFPSETGWQIVSADGDVVAKVPIGGYSLTACFDIVDERVSVRANGLYTLILVDKSGDGRKLSRFTAFFLHSFVFKILTSFLPVCCKSGSGFVTVYYEEVSPDSLLLFLGGEFKADLNGTFVASPYRNTSSPSSSPTGAPSPASGKQNLGEPSKPTLSATSKSDSLSKASLVLLGVSIVCSYMVL
jgi:hypothetical protein